MPFPTTNATQELPAINQILTSCGQAPVTTLDQTNPEVAIAYATLLQVSREVQAEGWTFNREYHYEFNKDNNNEILIPNNVIQLKLSENAQNMTYDAVRRQGKLYDRQNHRYTWEYSPIECDVTWEFDWVDLPEPVGEHNNRCFLSIIAGMANFCGLVKSGNLSLNQFRTGGQSISRRTSASCGLSRYSIFTILFHYPNGTH